MRYLVKRGMGGIRQLGQPVENACGMAVLATFANTSQQRLLIDAAVTGLRAAGHTVFDVDGNRELGA